MKLLERNFGGELFRPTPEIHVEEDGTLCLIATPWGPRSSGKKLSQSIVDVFHSARNDDEVTSPFQKLTCLTPNGNSLRASIMLANDVIFREDNKNEYLSGLELFAAAISQNELVWVSIGQPHVLLLRENTLYPLSHAPESTLDMIRPGHSPAPLPQNLLGPYATSNFEVRHISLRPNDQIVLISRTLLPPSIFERAPHTLDSLSMKLAKDDSKMPFWLGMLDPS